MLVFVSYLQLTYTALIRAQARVWPSKMCSRCELECREVCEEKETALRRGVLEKLESVKTVERVGGGGDLTELNGEGGLTLGPVGHHHPKTSHGNGIVCCVV